MHEFLKKANGIEKCKLQNWNSHSCRKKPITQAKSLRQNIIDYKLWDCMIQTKVILSNRRWSMNQYPSPGTKTE